MRRRAALCVLGALAIAGGAGCNGALDFGAGARGTGGGGNAGTAGLAGRGGAAGSGGVRTGGPACTSDAECGPATLHCDVNGSKTCVQCVNDTHCAGTALPHCNVSLHRCVVCVARTDCTSTETCASGRCVPTCETPTSLPCPTGTACEDGICHACGAENLTCGTATSVCLGPAWICVACGTDSDCGDPTPRCDPARHVCVPCVQSTDCPASAPFCEPTAGTCVSG